jgi:hypothetical protein
MYAKPINNVIFFVVLCVLFNVLSGAMFQAFAGDAIDYATTDEIPVTYDSKTDEIDPEPNFGKILGMVGGIKYSYIGLRCVAVSGYGWTSLPTDLVIPDTVTIDNVSYSVTDINELVFEDHTGLKSLKLGDNLQRIGAYAFSGCTGLASVTFGKNVDHIGNAAFTNCKSLASFTIPASVRTIGEGAFAICQDYKLAPGNTAYKMEDGLLLTKNGALLLGCPTNRTGVVSIPDTVKKIGDAAFAHCERITSVDIPDSVIEIGGWAFSGCVELSGVKIPDVVGNIGNEAFINCTSLAKITIPSSVGNRAFVGCTALTDITFTDGVKTIGKAAFSVCPALKRLTFESLAPPVIADSGNYGYDNPFFECPVTNVKVPQGSRVAYKTALDGKIPGVAIVSTAKA